MAGTLAAESRHAAAWQRARTAKTVLALVAAGVFVAGIDLVRAHRPSHHRGHLRQLTAPAHFTAVVRHDLLQGGIVAPPQAPPQAATSLS